MKSLHRITGIIVSIFIVAHLGNHLMAIYGIETHIKVMKSLRAIYRNPFVEPILIIAFVFQSISGVRLFFSLCKREHKSPQDKIKMYSGILLALFIINHIVATIGQRYYFELDTNFYFAARVVVQDPLYYFFIPYYFFGVISFGVHLAAVHREKVSNYISPHQARIHYYGIIGLFLLISIMILLVFTGSFYEIRIPEVYNIY